MKNFLWLVLLVTALAVGASAQSGIVAEAKAQTEKEHHAALVVKAKHFLAEKAKLEARLAAIDKKLEKLDAGQDVKDDADATDDSTTTFVRFPGGCCIAAGGVYGGQ